MFSWVLKTLIPLRLSFTGGGGGDGGEAERIRAEEAQRKALEEQNIRRINAVFGTTDVDYTDVASPLWYDPEQGRSISAGDATSRYSRYVTPEYIEQYSSYVPDPESGQREMFSPDRAQAYLDEIATLSGDYDPTALQTQASENAAARKASLEGVYGDIMNYYGDELNRQKSRSGATLKADIARRGIYGSSAGQAGFDRLNELAQLKTADLEGKAAGAISELKAGDKSAEANLIDMIMSGGDIGSAMSQAHSGLSSRLEQTSQGARAENLTGLFDDLNTLYGQSRYVDQYNQGLRQGSSGVVTPGTRGGYSGTIVA